SRAGTVVGTRRCLSQKFLARERFEDRCRMLRAQSKHACGLQDGDRESRHLQEFAAKTQGVLVRGGGGEDHRHTSHFESVARVNETIVRLSSPMSRTFT